MSLPALNGNWIDLFIILILFFYVFEGWRRGFIQGLIDVAGFILSLVIALRFYNLGASLLIANFQLSRGIANALGFLLIAFITELLFSLVLIYSSSFIGNRLSRGRSRIWAWKINMALGFIPSIASALVLLAFILTTLLTLPLHPSVKQSIVASKIGGFLTSRTLGLEQSLSSVFGGAIEETLTFFTVKPTGNEVVDLRFKTKELTVDQDSENRMLTLVNQARIDNGLPSLTGNSELQAVARAHCTDMFERGYFSHYTPEGLSPFDRMERAGIRYSVAGENLAYAPTVEIAHQGFMNSPGHRANILSPDFGKAGIGVISGGIYGRMFCQEFTN